MAKILITGGTGLVGTALIPLFEPTDEVHAVTRSPVKQEGMTRFYEVDLGSPLDTGSLPTTIDAVIYLAQSENYRDFPDQARDIFEVNVANLLRMLDYARRAGAGAFVIASTGSVYRTSAAPVREDSPLAPTGAVGFYPSSKLCGEILGETFSPFMNIAILRLFFAYGAGQKRSMLIPRLVDSIREGRPVVLHGQRGICINPIHATDAAVACYAALGLSGFHKINVAGPEILSLRDLCELIGERVERRPIFDIREGAEDADLIADVSSMTRLLGAPRRRVVEHVSELL